MTSRHGYPAVALSRSYRYEPARDSSPIVCCARLAAALIAILAVRAVVSNSGRIAELHIATPWILVVAALGAGVMLREAGRGLGLQLPRPRWSVKFVGAWAGSSGLLVAVLLASGGSLGFAAWISIVVAAGLGVVLAASWHRARRLLWSLARLRHRVPIRIRGSVVAIPCALTVTGSAPAPLLAGWSGRGPPLHLS
jgi:hypothetical protein